MSDLRMKRTRAAFAAQTARSSVRQRRQQIIRLTSPVPDTRAHGADEAPWWHPMVAGQAWDRDPFDLAFEMSHLEGEGERPDVPPCPLAIAR